MKQKEKNLTWDERKSQGRKKEQGTPDDEMRRTAGDLIQVAIQAFMKIHGVDRKTAQRWIASAAVTAAKREN